MIDVRGDVLRPPHGTTPAAVNLVQQRRISVLNFISVAQPQKFGNKKSDEQSRLATCIPLQAHNS